VGILALLAASVAAGAASGATRPPPILFTSNRPDFDLVVMRADGTQRRRITRGFPNDDQPAWSPDGLRIAFGRDGKVVVLDLRTGGLRTLAKGGDPDWAPDGRRLVFRVFRAGREYLATARANGSGLRALPASRGVLVARPAWSPDGSLIAFEEGSYLWLTDPAGRHRRRLPTGGYSDSPAWTPDGLRITFTCGQDEWCEVRRDGTHYRRHRGGDEPSWSPGGELLAVTSLDGHALRLIRPDGRVVRTLVRSPHGPRDSGYGEETEPDFSPDGLWLVVTRDAGHKPTLYAIGPNGGGARLSPDLPNEEDAGAWSPDGRQIAFRLRNRRGCFLALRWPATGRSRRLARARGPASCSDRPAWSRDGHRIVYAAANDLWTIPSGGGRSVRVTNTPKVVELGPRWKPDGTLTYRDRAGIWLVAAGGTPALLVAGGQTFAWSHRGGRLAYIDASGSLVVRSAAGDDTTLVSFPGTDETGDFAADPSWSPDDGRIAFTVPPDPSDRFGEASVAVIDVASHRLHVVAESGDQWRSWSPDWRG